MGSTEGEARPPAQPIREGSPTVCTAVQARLTVASFTPDTKAQAVKQPRLRERPLARISIYASRGLAPALTADFRPQLWPVVWNSLARSERSAAELTVNP